MKYYKINENTDLGVIGHYPQVNYNQEYNPRLPTSHWQVKGNKFPKFSPELELVIVKDAIPTNFLERTGTVSFGMIIDKSFKEILERHNLPSHHFYPIKVYYKNVLLDYYWIHWIIDDFWDLVDKEKTILKKYNISNPEDYCLEKLTSKRSLDTFLKKKEIGYSFAYERLVFHHKFNYDLYETIGVEWNTVISEKLKDSLENSGMTGFETKPYFPLDTIPHRP